MLFSSVVTTTKEIASQNESRRDLACRRNTCSASARIASVTGTRESTDLTVSKNVMAA